MSFIKRHWALSILAWFVALFTFNVALNWPRNADEDILIIVVDAIGRFLTLPELVPCVAAVYGIVSKRQLISTRRLFAYVAVGLSAVVATFVLSYPTQVANASGRILRNLSSIVITKARPLSPVEVFQKASSSVYVVEALGENGESLDLGSAVSIAPNLLITNCHVIQNGFSLRVSRGERKWVATLVQALPKHDLCGLRPGGLTLVPVSVRSSSTLETGESVYAIGAPEGLELTFSGGVISALRETEGVHVIQTSAPTSPGSSGGGLFDSTGNLVGITSFQVKEGQSLNFALPGEWVADLLEHSKSGTMPQAAANDEVLESAAWIAIGLEAVNQKNYDLGENCFQRAANLQQPDAYQAWYELGRVFQERAGDESNYTLPTQSLMQAVRRANEQAVPDFEQAIRLKPDSPEAWLYLAIAHQGLKHWSKALVEAKEAVRLDPHSVVNWVILGHFYEDVGLGEQAIDAYQQALQISPNNPRVLYDLGSAYAKKGNREQAVKIYEQLKEKSPTSADDFFREYVLVQPATASSRQTLSGGQPKMPHPEQRQYDWARDAAFRSASPSAQRGYLSSIDPSFAKASRTDQDAYIVWAFRPGAPTRSSNEQTMQQYLLVQREKLLAILNDVDTMDSVRVDAKDAFYAATDREDFQHRLAAIPLPNKIKADLWDLKFGDWKR